ncbi:MAG: polysaccharide biosynthesis protein [Clostridia bacterium]|nr:polysaccharide biosynthesis protein [Clostridia bacterium]
MVSIRRIMLLFIDVLLLGVSYTASYIVSKISEVVTLNVEISEYILNFLAFAICIFGSRLLFKVYVNIWRYANTRAYLYIIVSDFVGSIIAILITKFLFNTIYVNIWNTMVNVTMFTLATLMTRFLYQYSHNMLFYSRSDADSKINVAIIGAGKTGSLLVEELMYNSNSNYRPLCFVDINKERVGGYISGIRIIEENDDVIENLKKLLIKEIFIALPSLSSNDARRIYDFYSQSGCKIKLYDFAIGENSKQASGKPRLREFRIEDLLFRDTHNINGAETYQYYENKVVLVTGGGGSIGSEICRQIAKAEPSKLIIFDIYENNAYEIQQELIRQYEDRLEFFTEIGSVRDTVRLEEVFEKYRPDVVFHAAAHKHVPLMENNCCEAVKNNIFGTYNVANCAEKYGVRKFIMISTDKAVNPTNVMGATKRVCEMIVQSRHDSKTTEFAAVRFGNVLGSNGSVIPLFRRQIENGGPVTITDKRIIRYFMTIPEASQLVLQAGAMATKGELFVLDMGNPVRILDLAENMIKLVGLRPYDDIDIIETGLRPGEKLYEELLIKTEELDKTNNDLIFIEKDKPFTRDEIDEMLDKLMLVLNGSNEQIKEVLKAVVSTYSSPEDVNKKAAEADEMRRIYKSPSISEFEV